MVDPRSPVELSFWAAASEHRRRKINDLRHYEAQPYIARKSTYAIETLMDHRERGKLAAMMLQGFCRLPVLQQWLLGIFTLCCMERRARALRGTRKEWGWFLGICGRSAYELLAELVELGWLVRLPRFRKGKSLGRDGEPLDHRQRETWYAPGPLLRECFKAHKAEQVRRSQPYRGLVGSIPGSKIDPLMAGNKRSPSGVPSGSLIDQAPAVAKPPAKKTRQLAPEASAATGSEKEAPGTAQEGLGAAGQPETAAAQPAAPATPAERPASQGRPAPPAGVADKKGSPAVGPSTAAGSCGVDDIPIAYRDIFKRGIEYGIPVKALHRMFASDRDVFVSMLSLIGTGNDFARRLK